MPCIDSGNGRGNGRRGSPPSEATCSLCARTVPTDMITLHHLLPKEHGGTAAHRLPFCRPCHKQIHALFSNKQLADKYSSIDALRAAPELAAFLPWIRKQRENRNFRTATSASHPKRRKR
jgi:hypothetical protein